MEIYLIKMFAVSLTLTLSAELAIALLFRWCKRRLVLLVILVNLLTNPPAVLICWLGRIYLPPFFSVPVQLLVELSVILTEAFIYCRFAKTPGWQSERPLRPIPLAIVSNLCSWLFGMICMNRFDFLWSILMRIRRNS